MSYAGHIWMNSDNINELNKLWYHILKSIVGAVLNISQRNAELILGLPPLHIQNKINSVKHFLKIINTPVQQDIYKDFLSSVYNQEDKSPHNLHNKFKEIFTFLKWKSNQYPTHFTGEDKNIVNENMYSQFLIYRQHPANIHRP